MVEERSCKRERKLLYGGVKAGEEGREARGEIGKGAISAFHLSPSPPHFSFLLSLFLVPSHSS